MTLTIDLPDVVDVVRTLHAMPVAGRLGTHPVAAWEVAAALGVSEGKAALALKSACVAGALTRTRREEDDFTPAYAPKDECLACGHPRDAHHRHDYVTEPSTEWLWCDAHVCLCPGYQGPAWSMVHVAGARKERRVTPINGMEHLL